MYTSTTLNAEQRSLLQYNIKKGENMKHETTESRAVRQSGICPALDDAQPTTSNAATSTGAA
jgi:hypothetical protein